VEGVNGVKILGNCIKKPDNGEGSDQRRLLYIHGNGDKQGWDRRTIKCFQQRNAHEVV
jgi:hypothetical protein